MMENDIISVIRSKEDSEIKKIYYLYKEQFFRYALSRFSVDEETLADIYQESFIILYDNVRRGKLTVLSCSLKTYLFKIAINQTLAYLSKTGKYIHTPLDESLSELDSYYSNDEWGRVQDLVAQALTVLKHPCDQLFTLFYWQQKRMNEIAEIMGYKNEQVAKNRKSICLKRFKEYVVENLKKEDLL